MKFSTECFVRCAMAWFMNWIWRSQWASYGTEFADVPKGAVYIIMAAGLIGWWYLFHGLLAWKRGE